MDILETARNVISTEIDALTSMNKRLDQRFEKAVEIVQQSRGRVVVVGMGKSGIVGHKIAATLASTGTPSFFVHPGEAFHGDLGMIRPMDVALLISNSGETEEVIRLLSFLEYQQNAVIAMTGNPDSTLARHADTVLDISVDREACSNNLAPTSSTTATLVMGDALAVTLSSLKNFQPEDFARFHPGGNLGRRLLTRVKDIMHSRSLPVCSPEATFREVVHVMTEGRLGVALIMNGASLRGIITDGDVRRTLELNDNPLALLASEVMTSNPKTINENERFAVAEEYMNQNKINALVVVNDEGTVSGILQIYDLQRSNS
ncbi:KpsF/GutQ family sugar-phosphate isomerase [Gynuella sunshinyii]|uniref:Arabinose 5-phosphate isomerase n=1 Tax=Gynuella sunshinyii YC6258 TaxID=1445510 RepID=A0A0C5VHZ4_9GAMM|nr:KpsF/GutQ family sugar-phosphate isomerase [Gynuella sunshinyii]AJQ93891.1 putative sugar phosphate isomerase involved in capsule formation [Gynuella sunshinyii YC6258]